MKKSDVKNMLSLEAHIEVLEIQKKKEGKVNVNYITVKSSKNKVRCPICNQFTSTIHDYLKPSKILYLDVVGEKIERLHQNNQHKFHIPTCPREIEES